MAWYDTIGKVAGFLSGMDVFEHAVQAKTGLTDNGKLLVIDDEGVTNRSIKRDLEAQGYRVGTITHHHGSYYVKIK